jgi:outer membrane biosynthesis protein TonB
MRRSTTLLLAAVLALAFAAACNIAPNDAAIATDIKAKMFSDAQLKDSNLLVTVDKGQVTLAGSVPSDATRLAAYKLATEEKGVSKVNDQMTVEVAQAAPAPVVEQAPARATAPAPERKKHAVRRPVQDRVENAEPALAPAPEPVQQPAPSPAPAPVDQTPPPPPPPPPQPQPKVVELPAGTTVSIRMIDGVDSSVNNTGEVFRASLDAPLVVNDEVVVPRGANVSVRLAQASSAGHMSGKSELRLELVKLDFQGKSYPMVSSTYDLAGSSRGKRTAGTIAGGAAIGALIGAIAGGGKGAAIGAGVGGGTGAVYQGATRGQQVKIPSETKLDFQLEQPVMVSYFPKKQSDDKNQ